MQKTQTTVTGLELKQLLIQLASLHKICFRFRLIGALWMNRHMRVISVSEKSVFLHDEQSNRFYLVKINSIVQFDLDERFQVYQPHFHYNNVPSQELD
jgi:hypothetical protein